MSALKTYVARRSLPKFTNYLLKAKLPLFFSSAAHDGRSGRQAAVRDFIGA